MSCNVKCARIVIDKKPEVKMAEQSINAASDEQDRRDEQGPDRRQTVVDRRTGAERRQMSADDAGYTGSERRSGKERRASTGPERRRGPGRRLLRRSQVG